jgi:hypothetical protein
MIPTLAQFRSAAGQYIIQAPHYNEIKNTPTKKLLDSVAHSRIQSGAYLKPVIEAAAAGSK